jgi:plasmid stability protein
MSNISIKDVPDQWAEALRQRAARNHRSLQGELMAIIERAVLESSGPDQVPAQMSGRTGIGTVVGHGPGGHPIIRQGWKSVDQIAAELRAKYPQPFNDGPLGVDIIRKDRDSR